MSKDKAREYFVKGCNEYLRLFCEKHDFDYEEAKESWVANCVGDVTCVGDIFVGMQTIIADIEMGGVFAAIAGTYVLLDDYDRSRLKATVINKFRGNLDILKPGLDRIEEITGEPVLGVLPYDETLRLPEEDSASLTTHEFAENKDITIGVIRLPKIANFTDIDPFEYKYNAFSS